MDLASGFTYKQPLVLSLSFMVYVQGKGGKAAPVLSR